MAARKLINKVETKRIAGKCHFCDVDDYALLNCHRITSGEEGGKYTDFNTLVVCANCHNRIHDGQIKIDRKYRTSKGVWLLHFWEGEEEKWL